MLQKIHHEVIEDSLSHLKYSIQQGKLLYKGRLVLSSSSKLISTILHTYHDSVMGGHSGFLRTDKRLTSELYWPSMKKDVQKYVAGCEVCQRHKTESLTPTWLLQPLPTPNKVWEAIAMAFVVGLPRSMGQNVIYVVINRLSKYAHFIPTSYSLTPRMLSHYSLKRLYVFVDFSNP